MSVDLKKNNNSVLFLFIPDTLSSHWKEKSDSSSIYASLINNETGHQTAMETSADRQYEMIDSQSNSNMYTFISTNSTKQ